VWETHPVCVASVYKFIAQVFELSIEETTEKLVQNIEDFYKIK
jgi:Tat protein secretion system quality control protein TatD with DNase activity